MPPKIILIHFSYRSLSLLLRITHIAYPSSTTRLPQREKADFDARCENGFGAAGPYPESQLHHCSHSDVTGWPTWRGRIFRLSGSSAVDIVIESDLPAGEEKEGEAGGARFICVASQQSCY